MVAIFTVWYQFSPSHKPNVFNPYFPIIKSPLQAMNFTDWKLLSTSLGEEERVEFQTVRTLGSSPHSNTWLVKSHWDIVHDTMQPSPTSYAIKFYEQNIHQRRTFDPAHFERRALQLIDAHTCALRVLGSITDERGNQANVLEYLPGGALADLMQREQSPLGPKFTVQIATKLLDFLMYMHDEGVAHCNITPSTVMFAASPETDQPIPAMRLTDFAHAVIESSGPKNEVIQSSGLPGPWGAMEPELLRGGMMYVSKVDMFMLGTLLYEMLSCKQPWTEDQLEEFEDTGKLAPLCFEGKFWEEVPDFLKTLVEKCLSEDPEKRPTAKRALQWLRDGI